MSQTEKLAQTAAKGLHSDIITIMSTEKAPSIFRTKYRYNELSAQLVSYP